MITQGGGREHSIAQRTAHLPPCLALCGAAYMATKALRDIFVFMPGFVPWAGESPQSFRSDVGGATALVAVALLVAFGVRDTSVRAAFGRFVNALGLWPSSARQALRWLTVGLVMAVALLGAAQIIDHLPGLTSVPAAADARDLAVAQTSRPARFLYGLIAPAPVEELLYRGPVLALGLALLAAQPCLRVRS
ncbi:hypothetical protein AB0451_37970 [Streptomyces sp. NPDC052000]|uniref:hypothetical protein n=1 Tax=Streptomyces sp. NPDC052000 TaxID=3155676 RepID=UPI00344EA47F